ncbi:response regulator [Algoriphagus sediminis]|uniref:histidine kinase n=1 Tax=Algoriphagus sediminis TaxID=3057113 RepID=A0ABT7YC56_9BACT|nr:response regulator [Algoriphagus sediminis]MDN3204099.1 response regulator [Algoriphagus sediminis]
MKSLSHFFDHPFKGKLCYSVFGILFLFSSFGYSQSGEEIGVPLITNYATSEYGGNGQVWSIIQSDDQLMYFGTSTEIMEFDGINWRQIRNPDYPTGVSTRGMVKDNNGVIFYVSGGSFGYLKKNKFGDRVIESLRHLIPEDKRDFEEFWSVQFDGRYLYFQAREYIFRLDYDLDKGEFNIKTYPAQSTFSHGYIIHGDYIVHDVDNGLYKMVDEELEFIEGSEVVAGDRLFTLVEHIDNPDTGQKQFLTGRFYQEFYKYDGENFEIFDSDLNEYTETNLLYKSALLPNGNLVASMIGMGLVVVNQEGELLNILSGDQGLQDPSVYSVFVDQDQTVWVGLDNGISKLELNSPISTFTENQGLNSTIYAITRAAGQLYVSSSIGLFKYDDASKKFVSIPELGNIQIWNLVVDGDDLIVPGEDLSMIRDGRILPIDTNTTGGQDLMISPSHPNLLYISKAGGLRIFLKKGNFWEKYADLEGMPNTIWSIAESEDGTIWAGTQTNMAYRITPSYDENDLPIVADFQIKEFGVEEGLVKSAGLLYAIDGEIFFPSFGASLRYDPATESIVPDDRFGMIPDNLGLSEGFFMQEDSQGQVWIPIGNRLRLAIPGPDNTYTLEENLFNDYPWQAVFGLYSEDDGIVWIGSGEGLLRYDRTIPSKSKENFPVRMRGIYAGLDTLNHSNNKADQNLAYSQNSIRFTYAAQFYQQEQRTTYQTYLEGFESDWSDWNRSVYKEYTNLSPGTYTFRVRAKNVFNDISEEASYTFTIIPPWYSTWWAYLIYALLIIILVRLILKWRLSQLREKQELLEKTVMERTQELSQRVSELAVLNGVQNGLVKEIHTEGIYELVGEKLNDLFDTQTVVLRSFDHNSQQEIWHYSIERDVRQYSDPRPINWANRKLIETKQPLVINENYIQTARKFGGKGVSMGHTPKSAVFVPIIIGKTVRGSVSLQNLDREHAFSDAEVNLLVTITSSMGVALENTRLFDETNRLLEESTQQANELSAVNRVTQALASQLSLDEIIHLVGDQMKDLFNANIVYLALLNEQSGMINFPYRFGDEMPPQKLGEGLTSKILNSGEPLLINRDVEEMTVAMGTSHLGIPSASYLGVPIFQGEKAIGVLSVQSTEFENRFDESDSSLLSTIASSVGVAINKAQLFEEVVASKQAAEKANEAKSAFLSTVSHELRTPLTSVLGFAKIIQKRLEEKIFPLVDQKDPKTGRALNQVSQNLNVVISEGERLTTLINDVLDLAKIEAGKMDWSEEQVNLTEVVERAIAATNSLFESNKLKLIRDFDQNIPEISGDNNKLIQVVINLISNAVKFTEKGGVTCRIKRSGNEIITSIIDTGMGIAPEDFDAVFEQFKQVGGDTLTDKPKGTGLGLPICKEIIEHHGGRIWLESKVGEGSNFSFALPIKNRVTTNYEEPIHLDQLVDQLKNKMVFSRLKSVKNNAHILIVDDEQSIRSLLSQELAEAGYLTSEASNGKEAIESIRENRPDLVILDIMMPEINGFDVAAILKNDPQTMDIPIIILSIVQDKARGFRIGVDRYLTKPIDTNQLFEDIGDLLNQGKSKKKVMVVDEDSTAVRTLTDVLQTKGYQVVESDGKELVEKAKETLPDIIILNSILSSNDEIIQTLRFEKGLENVLFFIYQ